MLASLTLSFSTVILTLAVLWIPELTPALSVACGGLAAMSGGSYMAGRAWNGNRKSFTDRGVNDE
jgi:F0F1-type ATP synthase assembly protein I